MVLRYDGSLSGFLCLLGHAIKKRLKVTAITRLQIPSTADLFADEQQITTDPVWACQVTEGLKNKLGRTYLSWLAKALFSEEDGIELDLLYTTRRALHEGRTIMQQLTDPLINRIETAALRTGRERHRLLGLLRFCQLADGSYFARISPRNNVVPLLGSHFAGRLGDQRWLIVDEQRKLGVWGEGNHWEVVEKVLCSDELTEHESEQQVAELWRSFYHNISNPDRYNPKLRRQFMPSRYWQYLTEFQTEQRPVE